MKSNNVRIFYKYSFKSYIYIVTTVFILLFFSCNDNNFRANDNIIRWEKSLSPIYVDSCYTVPEGFTLIISPGVEVLFRSSTKYPSGNYKGDFDVDSLRVGMLRIQGKLIAEGTIEDTIKFDRQNYLGHWGIILFENTFGSENVLKYCSICNANGIIGAIGNSNFWGALSFKNSSAEIQNCIIKNNLSDGINCSNSSCPLILECNIISNNQRSGIVGLTSARINLFGNLIDKNYKEGLKLYSLSSTILINNIFYKNHIGITYGGESDISLINNTICSNTEFGIKCLSSSSSTNLSIINTIIWNNGTGIQFRPSTNQISHSLLQDDTFPEFGIDLGNNLLGQNPLFVDEELEDFRLKSNSPCIDVGNGDIEFICEKDFLGNPRISGNQIDIGALEYQKSK